MFCWKFSKTKASKKLLCLFDNSSYTLDSRALCNSSTFLCSVIFYRPNLCQSKCKTSLFFFHNTEFVSKYTHASGITIANQFHRVVLKLWVWNILIVSIVIFIRRLPYYGFMPYCLMFVMCVHFGQSLHGNIKPFHGSLFCRMHDSLNLFLWVKARSQKISIRGNCTGGILETCMCGLANEFVLKLRAGRREAWRAKQEPCLTLDRINTCPQGPTEDW